MALVERRAHLRGRDDALVAVRPLLSRVGYWKAFLAAGLDAAEHEAIRASERSGRPLGATAFVRRLEKKLNRSLAKRKPGPKPAAKANQPTLS